MMHPYDTRRVIQWCDRAGTAGIKDPVRFLESKRNQVFDWLIGVFPHGIIPTDIDGLVHINGYFLLLEFKEEARLRGGKVPEGQLRCLANLHLTNRFTVFLIGTDEHQEPTCMRIFKKDGSRGPLIEIDRDALQTKCKEWSASAESQPKHEDDSWRTIFANQL